MLRTGNISRCARKRLTVNTLYDTGLVRAALSGAGAAVARAAIAANFVSAVSSFRHVANATVIFVMNDWMGTRPPRAPRSPKKGD
jgi:hypothetical protein